MTDMSYKYKPLIKIIVIALHLLRSIPPLNFVCSEKVLAYITLQQTVIIIQAFFFWIKPISSFNVLKKMAEMIPRQCRKLNKRNKFKIIRSKTCMCTLALPRQKIVFAYELIREMLVEYFFFFHIMDINFT